jgi:hypothetical protein
MGQLQGSLRAAFTPIDKLFTQQMGICVVDAAGGSVDAARRVTSLRTARSATWRLAVNNLADLRYWSTIGPSYITGSNIGNTTADLGSPRTVSASVSIDFN